MSGTDGNRAAIQKWDAQLHGATAMAQFERALAGVGLTPDRFAFSAYMAAVRTPKLLEAPRSQLWLGVYAAAECGLSLQPQLQQMHLVPYLGREATVQPIVGYQGLVQLVARAALGHLHAPVLVFQRDIDENRFKYGHFGRVCDLDPVVKDLKRPRGIVRYVVVPYTNNAGVTTFTVCDRDQVLERREKSASWQAFKTGKRKSSPWNPDIDEHGSESGDFLAMVSKTGIRIASKTLPKSADHWGERAAKAEMIEGDAVPIREVIDVPDEAIPGDETGETPPRTTAPPIVTPPPGDAKPKPNHIVDVPPDEIDVFLAELKQADDLTGMAARAEALAPGGHARRSEVLRALQARKAALGVTR